MKLSTQSFVCFLLALLPALLFTGGCGPKQPLVERTVGSVDRAHDFRAGVLGTSVLVDRYGLYAYDTDLPYLQALRTQLESALETSSGRGRRGQSTGSYPSFSIVVLRDSRPLAASAGPGRIALSRGVIERLQREEELAFVIAHEMAHSALGHFVQGRSTVGDEVRRQEYAADRFAAQLLLSVGFNPWNALDALTSFYHYEVNLSDKQQYPDVAKRVTMLQAWLREQGVPPRSRLAGREFSRFQALLLGSRTRS